MINIQLTLFLIVSCHLCSFVTTNGETLYSLVGVTNVNITVVDQTDASLKSLVQIKDMTLFPEQCMSTLVTTINNADNLMYVIISSLADIFVFDQSLLIFDLNTNTVINMTHIVSNAEQTINILEIDYNSQMNVLNCLFFDTFSNNTMVGHLDLNAKLVIYDTLPPMDEEDFGYLTAGYYPPTNQYLVGVPIWTDDYSTLLMTLNQYDASTGKLVSSRNTNNCK
ncbi:hypothetical protein SAMD00019534_014980 [Acytostelium subglobosum LB1]|uniref:hypothetical protein n=1 Tax=Acytostelium subglobosum LB1 TaxID=1410327 RepID=UPI00064510A8|nr:hypothetical protein SAMD00019534_014980 [Acytostelium subglobosum LB1]GAM18323.1 hypothetical protein SAMD00019534_014980 [Acytostelium subglobosum LB1]|eukprot:XP_012757543.1 hypothetical protein SAMD00019534_014980 [Acytostelium subglobosum LB1]